MNSFCGESWDSSKGFRGTGFKRRCSRCYSHLRSNQFIGERRPDVRAVRNPNYVAPVRDGHDGCKNTNCGIPDYESKYGWTGTGELRRCGTCTLWKRNHGSERPRFQCLETKSSALRRKGEFLSDADFAEYCTLKGLNGCMRPGCPNPNEPPKEVHYSETAKGRWFGFFDERRCRGCRRLDQLGREAINKRTPRPELRKKKGGSDVHLGNGGD